MSEAISSPPYEFEPWIDEPSKHPAWFGEAPSWFRDACLAARTSHTLDVEGCAVHYQRWESSGASGDSPLPGVIFVHGASAHAHWWDAIAPHFAQRGYTCVAIDLSGHGDSGHRDHYSHDLHAKEIFAVREHARLPPLPVVVGHSFGGGIALVCGKRRGPELGGIVLVDSPIYPPVEHTPSRSELWSADNKTYDYATLVQRFRLMPPQPVDHDYLLKYIAHWSVRSVGDHQWVWKADKARHAKTGRDSALTRWLREGTMLHDVSCRMSIIYGSDSKVVNATSLAYMRAQLAEHCPGSFRSTPMIEMPGSGHHLILDQPVMFSVTLSAILHEWARQDAGQGDAQQAKL